MKYATLLFALALSLSASAADTYTVYKTIGAKGEKKYTQMPPQNIKCEASPAPNAPCEILEFRSDGRINTPGTTTSSNSNSAIDEHQNAELQRQLEEAKARENAERCRALRTNLANLNIGGRIYEVDANGNRVFLNDQEIQSKRQRTQQTINEFCK